MKEPKCTFCGEIGHYQTFCRSKPKKPIGTVTDVTKQWKAKNKKPISPVSEKRKKQLAEYRVVRDKYMEEHWVCQAGLDGCTMASTDLHHKAGKVGDLLINTEYFCALCRNCHNYIETHPAFAKERGYSLDRLDK